MRTFIPRPVITLVLIGALTFTLCAPSTATPESASPIVSASSNLDVAMAPLLATASPDGQLLYVAGTTSPGSAGALSWIDPSGPRETRRANIGGRPTGLAVSPDGSTIATSSAMERFVRILSAANGRLIAKVPVGGRPDALVIGPKGRSLFASINKGDAVVKIDLKSVKVTGRYPVRDRANTCHGRGPIGLAVTADSETLLLSCPAGGLFALRTANGKSIGSIDQADGGVPVSSPNGTSAYWGSRNELWGLDIPRFPRVFTDDLLIASDGDPVDALDRIRNPMDLAITPDGSRVYAAMPDIGSVSRVDVANPANPTTRLSVDGTTTFGAQQLAMTGGRLVITTADGRLVTVDTSADAVVGIDPLPFASSGARAVTRVIGPIPLRDSRVAFGWTTFDGPGGSATGSGVTVLNLG